jgi:hypothetical protein
MELLIGHPADCDAALLSQVMAEIIRSTGTAGAAVREHLLPVVTARRDELRL